MKGFNAKSVYDMDTDDGSLLWSITLENTSENYLEFGDVGLPMPWNNKYANIEDTYNTVQPYIHLQVQTVDMLMQSDAAVKETM